MARTDEQVLEREMQADAEHQQDHADLGELVGAASWSATKPGVNGPISDARQQIADQRRAQAVGDRAEQEGEHEPGHDGGDQRRVVRHQPASAGAAAIRRPARPRG